MISKLLLNVLIPAIVTLSSCHGIAKKSNERIPGDNALSLPAPDGKYVDINTKESVVKWKGSMLMGANNHEGFVQIAKGGLKVNDGKLLGGTFEIDMQTIADIKHGADNGLVRHLRSEDFFEVEKFPFASMVITKILPANTEKMEITGNLTIKGITRPVTFPAKIEFKHGLIKATAKLVIDRTAWNIRYNSGKFTDLFKDKIISDDIEFEITIVASDLC